MQNVCWHNCRNVCCFVFVAKDACTGNTCETPNKCLSHPCQNGGSCKETNNEQTPYTCDCGQGYPGSNCEGLLTYTLFFFQKEIINIIPNCKSCCIIHRN